MLKLTIILMLFFNHIPDIHEMYYFKKIEHTFSNHKLIKNHQKNILLNKTWETNSILGLNSKTRSYKLIKFKERKFVGVLTNFDKNANFTSNNVSFCGTDYFTKVEGKYEIIDNDKVKIRVDKVTYSGQDKRPPEIRKPIYLIFKITKTSNGLILEIEK